MKTLNEMEEERRLQREYEDRAKSVTQIQTRQRLELIITMNLPVYSPKNPDINRTNYTRTRQDIRASLKDGSWRFAGVLCDHCRNEMGENPSSVLLSNPPKRKLCCPGCGFIGYRTL